MCAAPSAPSERVSTQRRRQALTPKDRDSGQGAGEVWELPLLRNELSGRQMHSSRIKQQGKVWGLRLSSRLPETRLAAPDGVNLRALPCLGAASPAFPSCRLASIRSVPHATETGQHLCNPVSANPPTQQECWGLP